VFILNVVKVLCFDTLLQVLILNGLLVWRFASVDEYLEDDPSPTPVFLRKSVDLLDCKGLEFFGNDKESARV
jgi:hypothetical protein